MPTIFARRDTIIERVFASVFGRILYVIFLFFFFFFFYFFVFGRLRHVLHSFWQLDTKELMHSRMRTRFRNIQRSLNPCKRGMQNTLRRFVSRRTDDRNSPLIIQRETGDVKKMNLVFKAWLQNDQIIIWDAFKRRQIKGNAVVNQVDRLQYILNTIGSRIHNFEDFWNGKTGRPFRLHSTRRYREV